ncbi:hypothetical protein [Streptomyces jumonjinensis]|uniref:Integral membrane protein n=1 Tax=Streptomyces jumonjinensis TaxID=1945 RepID=A0A646KK73_STRJU|nr:hypothetical protein [Streptomyces jumonjinensis]MQT01456.1 hypothetical protein [Streptomyces jumonjinensis]
MTTHSPAATATVRRTTASAATPLRRFLALDAVVTGGNGLIYLLASGPVGRLLDVNAGFLQGIGVFLTVYGLYVAYLATRPEPPVGGTTFVIDANYLWAVASVASLLFGWLDPNTTGTLWIPAQAVVVAAFAVLQQVGLRKMKAARNG